MKLPMNRLMLLAMGLMAAVLLLVQPRLLVAALPLACLAACPLAMMLMMRTGRRRGEKAVGSCHGAAQGTHVAETTRVDARGVRS